MLLNTASPMPDPPRELADGVAEGADELEALTAPSHGGITTALAQPDQPVRGAATAFSDITSVSAARGVSIVLALISVTIVTHLLHPTQYAILAYIAVISGLMLTATASWTAPAVTRYGREELERNGSIRATSWSRLIITAPLVAIAVLLVIGLKLLGALPGELTWPFVVIALATGLTLIAAEHVLNLLEACGRMKLTALALALQRALAIVGLVALIIWGSATSPSAIALTWLAVGCIFAVVFAKAVWRVGIWPVTTDRQLFRRMAAFSLPLIAFAVSQYVIQAVDVVILGAYRPAADVGLYAIAYNGYGVLQQLATTATIVLSPLFVSLRMGSREHLIGRFYDCTVPQVVFLSAIGAGLVAPLIGVGVRIVFGEAYQAAYQPLVILLLSWVLFAAASFVAPILVLHERARSIGAINAVAAVINVVGDWLLIGVFGVGIVGPAIVTAATLGIITIGYFHVAADCIGHRRELPAALMAPGVVGIGLALAVDGVIGVAVSIVGTLSTAVIVFVWRRPFAAEDIELIGKLDIPRPFKQLTLRALTRLG